MDKGALAGFLMCAVAILGINAVSRMSTMERVAAGLLGLGLAAYMIWSRPEKYLQPHVSQVDVNVMSGPQYVEALLPLAAIMLASVLVMYVRVVRIPVLGFWIGLSILLVVSMAITLAGGGF